MRTGLSTLASTLAAALAAALFAGCTTTKVFRHDRPHAFAAQGRRVALMPLDVELSLLGTGGMLEARADWTQAARGFLEAALERQLASRRVDLARPAAEDLDRDPEYVQLTKLHEAVGAAILANAPPNGPLPTLRKRFDWSLGGSAAQLARGTDADYALFVYVRDSYATAGRKALVVGAILVGAATGIVPSVSLGQQVGFASLVDLRTGDLVWFNRLSSETGDLREAEPAGKTAANLLEDFPL